MRCMQGRKRATVISLLVTLALGATFLWLKYLEYRGHFDEGIYPGAWYSNASLPASGARLFFNSEEPCDE